ncbi:MAG: AGE family epimerase/isomerase [Catalinimonas sp.]
MKRLLSTTTLGLLMLSSAQAQYVPTSNWVKDPAEGRIFAQECADFWTQARDDDDGGFYTWVNRTGAGLVNGNTKKSLVTHTRNGYGFARAFMLTGDTMYLNHGNHALQFLYDHGWDETNGGWFFSTDKQGNLAPPYGAGWNPNEWKWTFQQHYALVGISAMAEATRGASHLGWLERGMRSNYTHLWDSRPGFEGYYDEADLDWSNPRDKGFTPTVDAFTTHALTAYYLNNADAERTRYLQLADNVVDHMMPTFDIMPSGFGFAESYNNNWEVKMNSNGNSVGHVLKTGWCLARAYQIDPKPAYRRDATRITREVYYHDKDGLNEAYDHANGGPLVDFNWQTGVRKKSEKDYWQTEQAYVGGMITYFTSNLEADREIALQMADESIDFFEQYLVDHEHGEIYSQTGLTGNVVNATKGDPFKAGYHSIELGYYVYLYGNLYYHHRPATLHYRYEAADSARQIKLTPVAAPDDALRITGVTLDGNDFTDFDAETRTLSLDAGEGGVFAVTFEMEVDPSANSVLASADGRVYEEELVIGMVDTDDEDLTIEEFVFGLQTPIDATVRMLNVSGGTPYEMSEDLSDGMVLEVTAADGSVKEYTINGQVTSARDVLRTARLYPNPATDGFRLDRLHEVTQVRVVATDGRVMLARALPVGADRMEIATADWAAGMYYVQLSDRQGRNLVKKVVIQ